MAVCLCCVCLFIQGQVALGAGWAGYSRRFYLQQSFWPSPRDPKEGQRYISHIIPSVSSGSAPMQCQAVQLAVPWKPPKGGNCPGRILIKCKKHLSWLLLVWRSGPLWAPHPIPKAEPSHPMRETYFGCLYPQCQSSSQYPQLLVTGDVWNVDQQVIRKLCLTTEFPLPHYGLPQSEVLLMMHQTSCPSYSPLSHHLWTRPRYTVFCLGQELTIQPQGGNLPFIYIESWPQT